MTDRDTFAAAALTGILANPHDDLLASDDSYATMAYELADAMIRERLRQFDRSQPIEPADAKPATHATPGEGSVQGGSSTPKSYEKSDEKRVFSDMKNEPVAWAVALGDKGRVLDGIYISKAKADEVLEWRNQNTEYGARLIPLYDSLPPTLTAEEREAVEHFAREFKGPRAATLRSLLARLA
jgi:hypothetical protein